MRITLSLDEQLVKKAREIAIERSTTVTELVREYLQTLAAENADPDRKRRQAEALEQSFRQLQIRVGKRTWRRDDLHNRSQVDQ